MKSELSISRAATVFCLTIFVLVALAASAFTCAPTEEAIAQWKAEGRYDDLMEAWRQHRIANGYDLSVWTPELARRTMAAISNEANEVDTLKLCVILVDFPDYYWTQGSVSATRDQLDSILFSDKTKPGPINPTGSMTDFFREVSYGKLYVTGEVYGWYRADSTLSWFLRFGDNGLSTGDDLAVQAVQKANADIDFREYRDPGLSLMSSLVLIHAGPGAEGGGANIWSHRGSINQQLQPDSTSITGYIMNPEENVGGGISPIGVFCHEYGHSLGLPDFYDVAYNPGSQGLGRWALMASGNYNGNSQLPAHMCTFSKWSLGFMVAQQPSTNLARVEFPPLSTDTIAYALIPGGSDIQTGQEYWIVENRQPYGFDAGLPGFGLLIYHVDLGVFNQTNPSNYRIAVEQADGLNQMAFGGSRGDAADPFPGTTNNRYFHTFTTPDSRYYNDSVSEVGVWDISDSDSLMYADLDVVYSRPRIVLTGNDSLTFVDTLGSGDGDGFLEPGETVEFNVHVQNIMRPAQNAVVHMSSDVPGLTFVENDKPLTALLQPIFKPKLAEPIVFTMPSQLDVPFGNFSLEFTIDSAIGSAGGEYTFVLDFQVPLGAPEVLIVDDDGGQNAETIYTEFMQSAGITYQIWAVSAKGDPLAADLEQYDHVFWTNGYPGGGEISYFSRQALRTYLDNGGNLCLTTLVADTIQKYDAAFMNDYMHCSTVSSQFTLNYTGVTGSALGDGLIFDPVASPSVAAYTTLQAGNGGEEAFKGNFGGQGILGVSYDGTYKSVFLTFPLEMVQAAPATASFPRDTLFNRIMEFFGRIPTDIGDDNPSSLPNAFELAPNYPNPFNPTTTISYTINRGEDGATPKATRLAVFNALGQHVKTLVDEVQIPGRYSVEWNGTNQAGQTVASGVYFYRLSRDDVAVSRKMVLVK